MSFGLGQAVDTTLLNQTEAYGDVSDKYIATSTESIITELQKYSDFKSVGFGKASVRKQEKEGFQKHMVMLQDSNSEMVDGNLRLVLFNSNDRSTSIRLYMGYYRDACANDCVFGDDIMVPVSIKHTKQDWKYNIYQMMQQYEEVQKQTEAMIQRMMNQYISYGDIGRMAEKVSTELLNPSITGTVLDPLQLNTAHRTEDTGKNLWSTYNRFQYNLLQGGVDRVISMTEDNVLFKTISKTHVVNNDQKKIEFNRKLHTMFMEVA